MAVRSRGSRFQADFKLPGWPRVRETFTSHAEATAYEMTCKAAHAIGKPIPQAGSGTAGASKVMTIFDLIEHCTRKRWGKLDSKHADIAPMLAHLFAKWVGPKVPVEEALTDAKLLEYVEYRETVERNAGSTINRHMAILSVLAKEAARLKLIDTKPELPRRKESQPRLRVYSEAEETLILDTLTQWSDDDHHDLLVFLADTGCRLGETCKLTWVDFKEANGRLHIVLEGSITKNSTQRVLTATPRVKVALARMREKYSHLAGPFTWVRARRLRTVWDRLREHLPWMDKHTVIHTYRHTCLSRLVQRGADLYRVQIWAGHKDIKMTQRYAKFAPKQLGELADLLSRGAA